MYRVPVLNRIIPSVCTVQSCSNRVVSTEVEKQVWSYINDYELHVYTEHAAFYRWKYEEEVVKDKIYGSQLL